VGKTIGNVKSAARSLRISRIVGLPPWLRQTVKTLFAVRCKTSTGKITLSHSERFSDKAPAEVYATLIDESAYLARSAPCIASWQKTGS